MYNIAPTLCPSSSWLDEYYFTELSQKIRVIVGPSEWGTCIRTVSCSGFTLALAYWNNIIATSPTSCNIITFDALTGTQTTVLSGHTGHVQSLTFSLDGALLVSGSCDNTIKLWDVQTGGVVKTLYGHTDWVCSVSISADDTLVASGSNDMTIRLWNIKTGNCCVIEEHKDLITTVAFSPTNLQLFLSAAKDNITQQWSTGGHQIGPAIAGSHVVFSPGGTQFALCNGKTVTIRSTISRVAVATLNLANNAKHCSFSPDGGYIAAVAHRTIYVWDITGQYPCLIQTLVGHADDVTSLIFPSSLTLISASKDRTIKFWQIGNSSVGLTVPNSETTPPTLTQIRSVSLQVKDGLAFSIDSAGVVKIWDILTGYCKETYKTQAKDIITYADMQLVNDRLIIVWCEGIGQEIYIWDAKRSSLQTVDTPCWRTLGLRIIGDGSRVLQMEPASIQAWSIWTGESAGRERLAGNLGYHFDPLRMDSPRVLIRSGESSVQGWDFGELGSTPVQFSETSSDRPHLSFIDVREWSNTSPVRIEDSITGDEVFQLCGKYANPSATQWDGQYLIAGYASGEVLILDFGHVLSGDL